MAKLGPVGDKTHVSTRVMGTYGYCAPEYAMTGQLTIKSDIYGFGVVLLEIISGRRAVDNSRAAGEQNLVAWVRVVILAADFSVFYQLWLLFLFYIVYISCSRFLTTGDVDTMLYINYLLWYLLLATPHSFPSLSSLLPCVIESNCRWIKTVQLSSSE